MDLQTPIQTPPPFDRVLSGLTVTSSYQQQTELSEKSKGNGLSTSWCLQPHTAFDISDDFWRANNFADRSSIDILEINGSQQQWHTDADDQCIAEIVWRNSIGASSARPRLLAFFVSLVTQDDDAGATYRCTANISTQSMRRIISNYTIGDAFLPDLIGRPDYWAPFALYDELDSTYEFHCQHPRWQKPEKWDHHSKHPQHAPTTTYMKHFGSSNMTVYIVAAAPNNECISSFRDQLSTERDEELKASRIQSFASGHPFLLHCAVSSIIVEQSKDSVHHVRKDLMTQINQVNDYGKPTSDSNTAKSASAPNTKPSVLGREGRAKLEAITKKLHVVSQMADTGIANTEKAIENCEYIRDEYARFQSCFADQVVDPNMISSIKYSLNAWICQKRLLMSYKARKETSMNLVFNLVTQEDSAVNVQIAFNMLQDSSSMKTIAILTMVFLPGTFMAALFSSGIFITDASGFSQASDLLMPFIYSALPITLLTLCLWGTRGMTRRIAAAIITRASKAWTTHTMRRHEHEDLELG